MRWIGSSRSDPPGSAGVPPAKPTCSAPVVRPDRGGRDARAPRGSRWLLLCVATVVLVGCAAGTRATAEPPDARILEDRLAARRAGSETLTVGLVVDLGEDGESIGRAQWEGARLAVEDVNARGGARLADGRRRPVELAVYDDDGDAARTGLTVRSMVDRDRSIAIVGASTSESARAMGEEAGRLDIPFIALADPHRPGEAGEVGDWTFSLALTDRAALLSLGEFLAAGGSEAIGWIAPRTAAAAEARESFVRQSALRGPPIVAEESYWLAEEDLGEQFARLTHAGARRIVAWPRGSEDAARLARAAHRFPFARLYLGPAAAHGDFLTLLGDEAAGVRTVVTRLLVVDDLWDHDPLTPPARDFVRAYRLRHERVPSVEAAAAWDALRLIVSAIERSGSEPARLRSTLEAIDGYFGASGRIGFSRVRRQGLDQGAFIIARGAAGRWRLPP
jgi:branched-chain amino acid transport system substrate-binding protein